MAAGTLAIRDGTGATQLLTTLSGNGTAGSPYILARTLNDGVNSILSGSAANIGALSSVNALLAVKPGEWAVTSAPAVNTQASASKAAGAAGVRHVCTGISVTVAADATGGTAIVGTLNLRDGATGAGTVLASWTVAHPGTIGITTVFSLGNLNVIGTAATAMTLEFAAAPGAHLYQSCNLFGYDTV
jgi:hypothetical protein